MPKVAVFIPCFHLTDHIDKVVKQYMNWGTTLIISRNWFGKCENETAMRNEGIARLSEFDFVWTVDGDEILLKADQEKIMAEMIDHDYGGGLCRLIDYLPGNKATLEDVTPLVIVRPKRVQFYEGRCCRVENPHVFEDIRVHHFGRLLSPEKMAWKLANFWEKKDGFYLNPQPERVFDAVIPEEIRALSGGA